MNAVRAGCLVLGMVVGLSDAANAQGRGAVAGTVTDAATDAPIQGASVFVDGWPRRTSTDARGAFRIPDIDTGQVVLHARFTGYVQLDTTIAVLDGETVQVSLRLARLPTTLGVVTTEARSVERELFVARPSVGTVTLTPRSTEGVPRLGEADVVRVVQMLPGVGSRNDFTTGYNVRGGESSQNLILLDGLPIYNPFHFGGLFSTFIDASLSDVTFIAGGFPARYGGRLSSVLDASLAEDHRSGVHGATEVSVIATTLQLGGGIGSGRGSWMVAGRRTYADKLAPLVTGRPLPYYFHDGLARVSYALPGATRLSVTAFSGRDVLDLDMAEAGDSSTNGASAGRIGFSWGNKAIGANIERTFPSLRDSTTLRQSVSVSGFTTTFDAGGGAIIRDNVMWDRRLAGSATAFGRRHDLTAGYEVVAHRLDDAINSPETGISFVNVRQRPTSASLYLEDQWRAGEKLQLESGIRVEGVTGTQWTGVSPRLSAKYFVTPDVAVTGAIGRFSQWMHSLTREDTPIRFFDYWQASDATTPVSGAWHWILGVESWLSPRRFLRAETYYKRYANLPEYDPSEDQSMRGDEFDAANGESYGADLMLRQVEGGRLSGWVTYSLAVSRRTINGLTYYPAHDRRHDLDATGTMRLGKYILGGRFGYRSGVPYTAMRGEFMRRTYDPVLNRWGSGGAQGWEEAIGGERNGSRYPATQRMDLSATRTFRRRGTEWSPYVSVVNVYNASNVFLYTYDFSVSPTKRQAFSQLPIVPTIGLAVRF
jgi:hypothetical protein